MTDIRINPALPTPKATFKQTDMDIFKSREFAERKRGWYVNR